MDTREPHDIIDALQVEKALDSGDPDLASAAKKKLKEMREHFIPLSQTEAERLLKCTIQERAEWLRTELKGRV